MGVVEALAVCQCGHKKSIHLNELECCSCECRTFVLPAPFTCMVCGEPFESREKLEAHFVDYGLRKK